MPHTTYQPSEWLALWDDPSYIAYKQHIYTIFSQNTTRRITHILKQYYSLPIYGNAVDALAQETDPQRRIDIMNYIAAMRALKARGHVSSMDFDPKTPPQPQHTDTRAILYIKRLPSLRAESAHPRKPIHSPDKKKIKKDKNTEKKPKEKKQKKDKAKKSPSSSQSPQLSQSLAAELPFKRKSECKSSARSAKHYISKADLVSKIKSTPRLKDKVGSKIASMSKDEICDKIFE